MRPRCPIRGSKANVEEIRRARLKSSRRSGVRIFKKERGGKQEMAAGYAELAHREQENWELVCQALIKLGVVTPEELASSKDWTMPTTPGRVLLEKIRRWGDSSVQLHLYHAGGDK